MTNLVTPWSPVALLGLLAALIHLLRGRVRGAWLSSLIGLGLAMVGAVLVLLRLSPESAPLSFPWPAALGSAPQWAADPELFPFAIVIFLVAGGAAVARETSLEKLVEPLFLAAATFLFLFAENLPALAISWVILEVILVALKEASPLDVGQRGMRQLDAVWGFLALAGILFAWNETQGAALRAYGAAEWTLRARGILLAVILVRLGVYPLTSRRLSLREARLEPLDAFAILPVVAGLALAERLALLGPIPYLPQLAWLGALSAPICGFSAWNSPAAARRVQWGVRAALALVLLAWGVDVIPPPLLFPSAAASIGLGFGLWMLRPPEPSPTSTMRMLLWWFFVWGGPVIALGLGPLAPTTYSMMQLWQRLLETSRFLPLVLGIVGQALLMAALLRTFSLGVSVGVQEAPGWSMIGLWSAVAVAVAVWPRALTFLAGLEWQEVAVGLETPLSPGVWAAMVLPLLAAIALPSRLSLGRDWLRWANRVQAFLSLSWLHQIAGAAGRVLGRTLRQAEEILSESGTVAWALAFLIGLLLMAFAG